MGWLLAIMPLVLLALGIPIFLILLTTSEAALLFLKLPSTVIPQVMFDSLDKFPLLAVPFFIFSGELMARGGISRRLLQWVTSIIGTLRGSLAMTTLGTATIFGAISGATTASVAAVGALTYQPLRNAGYDERFSSGLITSAGALSNLIPPSLGMIIYGVAAQSSFIALFAAGIFPGLVMAGLFGLYVYYYAVRNGIREKEAFSWREFTLSSRRALWALGAPVIILGGIYTGVFSPTEAGGAASIYAILVTYFVYREVTLRDIFDIAATSMRVTALIFIIVAASGIYAWLLTISGIAQFVPNLISSWDLPPWLVLIVINVFLLLVGTALDTASALLVLTPLLIPIAQVAGVDPIHFGVIVVMNLTIGTFTPPFGLNIFVAQAVMKVPLSVIYPGLVPFILLSIVALLLVTYIPALSLWILPYLL